MNTVSMNNLWAYLQGLSLSASNKRWLGERLINSADYATTSEKKQKVRSLEFLLKALNVKIIHSTRTSL